MKQAPTRLLIVRHGETVANRSFRYIGERDDPLSEQGLWQAEQLAEALSHFPIKAVYCSPMQRTRSTAVPIAQRHELAVNISAELREGSFGLWEGLSRAEVEALSDKDREHLLTWERDPAIAPPYGESFVAIQARVLSLIERLIQEHAGETVLLVSHVGPIKTLLCAALGAPLTSLFQIFLDPATINVVDWFSHRPTVRLINSHAHLGWHLPRWL